MKPSIKKVIFSEPATIILWSDGTKTISKCDKVDKYEKKAGFLIAYLKKFMPVEQVIELLDWCDKEEKPKKKEIKKEVTRPSGKFNIYNKDTGEKICSILDTDELFDFSLSDYLTMAELLGFYNDKKYKGWFSF